MAADTTSSLAEALAAFQSALPRVEKDNVGVIPGKDGKQGYKYEYADLADITAVALPLLGQHGLSWSTKPTVDERDRFVLEYRLRHASGEEDIGAYPLPDPTRTPPQQVGSHITYARRYALCSVTGIAPGGDDDDGAQAQHTSPQGWERRSQPAPADRGHEELPGDEAPRQAPATSTPVAAAPGPAAHVTGKLLEASTEKHVEWWTRKAAEYGIGESDATAHIPEDDRPTLGIDEGDTVTVAGLIACVGSYWAKHHHGPRQVPEGPAA